jgi:hypothetical protein
VRRWDFIPTYNGRKDGDSHEHGAVTEQNEWRWQKNRSLSHCRQLQLSSKVIAGDIHALPQIEAVRSMPLHARVQVELSTSALEAVIGNPIQQISPVTGGACGFIADEIIDIHKMTPRE